MAPNHSKLAAIEEDRFLAGTRVLSVRKGGQFLPKKVQARLQEVS